MEELTQDGAQLARTMLMSAAQLAESMARVQAQRAWMTQSRATAQAAQAQQQIAAERDAARMIFRPLTDARYWRDAPQLDRVVQAYVAAASWAEHDPEARAALELIKQHAEHRWDSVGGSAHDATTTTQAQVAKREATAGTRSARSRSNPGVPRSIIQSLQEGRIAVQTGGSSSRAPRSHSPADARLRGPHPSKS